MTAQRASLTQATGHGTSRQQALVGDNRNGCGTREDRIAKLGFLECIVAAGMQNYEMVQKHSQAWVLPGSKARPIPGNMDIPRMTSG